MNPTDSDVEVVPKRLKVGEQRAAKWVPILSRPTDDPMRIEAEELARPENVLDAVRAALDFAEATIAAYPPDPDMLHEVYRLTLAHQIARQRRPQYFESHGLRQVRVEHHLEGLLRFALVAHHKGDVA